MVDVNMNPIPPKVIGREDCLWPKGPSGLSKDFKPKRRSNTLWKEQSKEIRDFMKVENGGVHCKKNDGCWTKQWTKIPKVPWTATILKKRSTCWASIYKASLMKDDMKVKVPNKTPITLIPLDGVGNWDGVLKFSGRPKGDHAMHF